MTERPRLYGADYSVYTRIARLACAEKAIAHDFETVDIFAKSAPPPADYAALHPFGKIPALRHGDFALYETQAIVRYLDAAFPGPRLTPEEPRGAARMAQVMGVADSYAYPRLVWGILVAEREGPGVAPEALDAARTCLAALDALFERPFFLGDRPSLADLQVAPMLVYLALAPSGPALLEPHPRLRTWLAAMRARDSLRATRYPAETG
ncbi:hypothetical protein AY599_03340 [Leptolyngbya valderiana BDU 20041]|nr:hypothetical protein AY599_03340 [Leptolyngbya valderiana BDU 20041]